MDTDTLVEYDPEVDTVVEVEAETVGVVVEVVDGDTDTEYVADCEADVE